MRIVELNDVTMQYPGNYPFSPAKTVLNGVTIHINEGEVFGLIGPNGAGKSTTIKLLLGLLSPKKGNIQVFGKAPANHEIHKFIGYLPEQPYFYDYLTGRELLNYYGRLHNIPRIERNNKIVKILAQVGLEHAGNTLIRKYSKGMMQRLGLAQAILHTPKLLFLDEPMSGLDPLGRHDMSKLIQHLGENGITIIFCSHILHDIETLCHKIAILHNGTIGHEGKLQNILTGSVQAIEVILMTPSPSLYQRLIPLSESFRKTHNRLSITVKDLSTLDQTLNIIHEEQGHVIAVNTLRQTLEEFFVEHIKSS